MLSRICVFCGSSEGDSPIFTESTRRLGTLMAERNIGLVYGGGCVGLMGALADAVLAASGEVDGVIPNHLMEKEVGHSGVTRLHLVDTMHQRKAMMAELSNGFIALPGGLGTLEELFEVWTWAQLGLHAKPVGLWNIANYYDDLISFLNHTVDRRFVKPEFRSMLVAADDPADLIDQMTSYRPPDVPKWMDQDES
jgi:uncharacterized protein (TIGR00730 family)